MLSFLRDQSLEDLPAQQKADAATEADKPPVDEAEKSQSQESEFLTVTSDGKRVRKTTTLLAILFVIGLLCLWFMIKKSTPNAASAANGNTEDTLVETAIARLTGVKTEMFGRMDEIVGKFYEFSEVPQIEVNELAKNPFELETISGSFNSGIENKADARMLWQQQLRQNSKGMQLWSIMQTHQGNRCMINDEILGEGDSIKGFEVIQIGDSFVKLESDGVQIELKLSE
jgi:preprotein translocase subunit SecG